MMGDPSEEENIMMDIQNWVGDLQASVAAAGQQMMEEVAGLQSNGHQLRPRLIRNNSVTVWIRRHLGYIEFEVKAI